jgi:mannose-1-phosphate guanylyltransferase
MALHGLIMAGGGGTRFWPRSRQRFPKQFLNLTGDRSLIQQARHRLEALVSPEHTWVITSAQQRPLVLEQLPDVPPDQVVGEPVGRDTAACLGLGAAIVLARDPQASLVCTPADHVIEPVQEFRRTVQAAAGLAEEHPRALITFGITPSFPAQAYGYIQRGQPIAGRQGVPAFRIAAFKEKPDADTAEHYLQHGGYCWNSGIFVWKAAALLGELNRQRPEIHAVVHRIAQCWPTPERDAVFRQQYDAVTKISIDYAVMEHCAEGLMLQAPFTWDDVGSWEALERMHPQDAEHNTIQATHCGLGTRQCIVVGEPGRLIATAGLENLLIVQDGDATLVADRRDEAALKKLVERLKLMGFERFL